MFFMKDFLGIFFGYCDGFIGVVFVMWWRILVMVRKIWIEVSVRKEIYIDGKFEVVLVFEMVELLKKFIEMFFLYFFYLVLNIFVSECCVYGSKDENLWYMKFWLFWFCFYKYVGLFDGLFWEFDYFGWVCFCIVVLGIFEWCWIWVFF